MLVRRPTGKWDNLYEVSQTATLPSIHLNEDLDRIRVLYTSRTNDGDILYRESGTSKIAFGKELVLIRGVNNYASSSHQNFQAEVVVLASNSKYTVGGLARMACPPAHNLVLRPHWQARAYLLRPTHR